ncbi:uncharacterized protein LOC144424607 [Styela clava]
MLEITRSISENSLVPISFVQPFKKILNKDGKKNQEDCVKIKTEIQRDAALKMGKSHEIFGKEQLSEEDKELIRDFRQGLSGAKDTFDLVEVFHKYRNAPEIVVQECVHEISVKNYNLNNSNIKVFYGIISKCKKLNSLTIHNTGKPQDLKNFFRKIEKTDCQIAKIHVWGVENLQQYCDSLLSLVEKANTEILEIRAVRIQNCDLEVMKETVEKLEMTGIKLRRLDMSRNRLLTNFDHLGEVVRMLPVTEIVLMDCNLNDTKVETFCQHLGDKKMEVLNFSGNGNITATSLQRIGQLLSSEICETSQIYRVLSLRCCDIDESKLNVLQKFDYQTTKIFELDVSYNASLQPSGMSVVGTLVTKFEVNYLGIAGCSLNSEHMKMFTEPLENSIKPLKLEKLNISDNPVLGRGVAEVAHLMNICNLKNLNLSQCMLSTENVYEFVCALDDKAEIESLNLSDEHRSVSLEYVKAVSGLLRHVSKKLIIKFKSMTPSSKQFLQKMLEELNVCNKPALIY